MKRRRVAAVLVAVTAAGAGSVALVAPSGAAVRAQQSEQPDACTIVPETDLEAAAGYPLEAGEQVVSSASASGCGFQATTRSDGPDIGILVTTTATRSANKTFSVKALERGFGRSKMVADLGRRANYVFEKGKVPQAALLVVDGTDGVIVTLRGATTRREARAEATAIATLVLGALGGTAGTTAAATTTTPAGE